MNQSDQLNLIEDLNLDYLNILNGKNYSLGKKIKEKKNYNLTNLYKKVKRKLLLKGIAENKIQDNLSAEERKKINEFNSSNYKVVVYSCITGKYDNSIIPKYTPSNVKYIMYTNDDNCPGWECRKIPKEIMDLENPVAINRYIKFNPHELFNNEFDFSIYIDGNINVISDLSKIICLVDKKYGFAFHRHYARQSILDEAKYCIAYKKGNKSQILELLKKYEDEKFPLEYGLVEGNVIVNDLKNLKSKKIMKEIWNEFNNLKAYRDQLIIPYVLWKNSIEIKDIATLGNNVYKNPKIRVEGHKK